MAYNGIRTNVFKGDIGLSPGNQFSGSVNTHGGKTEILTPPANECANHRITAYNAAAGAPCSAQNSRTELAGLTLPPGVYCSGSEQTLSAGALILDGKGDSDAQFIFQAGSSLTTALGTQVKLINGAQAKNVYWKVGSSASLATNSEFVGTILAYASVTLGKDTKVTGRALAGAAVTVASQGDITLA